MLRFLRRWRSREQGDILPADEPPKNGVWIDSEDDVLARPTDEELKAGKWLGESINTADDEDSGL